MFKEYFVTKIEEIMKKDRWSKSLLERETKMYHQSFDRTMMQEPVDDKYCKFLDALGYEVKVEIVKKREK